MAGQKASTKSGATEKRKTLTTKKKSQSKQADTEKSEAKVLSKLVSTGITPDDRSQMIAEAAFYRAEKRGFDPEGQVEDWLDAELEVDTKLRKFSQVSGVVSH